MTETDTSGAIQRRYIRGDAPDELLAIYSPGNLRFPHADERGSVMVQSDQVGAAAKINRYYEYGFPASTNVGRFKYAGQMWLPEAGLYHYKARPITPASGGSCRPTRLGTGTA